MNKKLLGFVASVPISYIPRYAFSDLIYNFNNAFCKLGLRFTDFSKLDPTHQEYQKLSAIGINRFFYDVQNRHAMNEFLEEKMNDKILDLIEQEILSGVFLNLPLNKSQETFFISQEVQAFMQCSSQLQRIISQSKFKTLPKFRIITGIDACDTLQFDKLENISTNFENIRSIIKNTFNFDLIFQAQHENNMGEDFFSADKVLKMFADGPMSLNLNLIKILDPLVITDNKERTSQFMQFLYEYSSQSIAYLVKDYKINPEGQYVRCSLGEGIISFSHIMDILKLSEFKGFVIFDINEQSHIMENVQYFDRLMNNSGFQKTEYIELEELQKDGLKDLKF